MSKIITTADGSHSMRSQKFGEAYHSVHGAIQEAQTVFIEAALHQKAHLDEVAILEIGFGTGLNAFMTFLAAHQLNIDVNYLGVEAYPIDVATAEQLNYHQQLNAQADQATFLKMHQNANEPLYLSEDFTFCKRTCLFQELDFDDAFDLIYFDAFAPSAQAELWKQPFLEKMYQALRPEGILTTYCAQGAFKRALKAVGFVVEPLPGPKGKREMTRAIKGLTSAHPPK